MLPDEYLHAFVAECKQLLEKMEKALLIAEQGANDAEIINADSCGDPALTAHKPNDKGKTT